MPGAGQAEGQRGLAAVRVLVQVGPHLGQARARVRKRCRRVLRRAGRAARHEAGRRSRARRGCVRWCGSLTLAQWQHCL